MVESTTHKLSVNQSTDGEGFRNTRVALAEEHRFDKDLILTISPCHPHQPHAVVENGIIKESNPPFLTGPAVTVNYFPNFSAATAVSELIFVIDQSGSMRGAYIEAAKETLMLFLRSIPDGCYFNIVGFGSSYKFLFQTSAPYDQAHLDQASDYTRAIRADMGGTELFQPLKQIFGMPSIKGLPKQVFVLTDGAVSDTTSVINEVKKNSHKARCFAVGIGAGASTALVKGVADAGHGSSEFVQSHEKMQGKVMQMLKRALSPSLSDVHVNWSLPDGVEVIQTPSKVLPLFSGDRLVIYGFISNLNTSLEEECRATLQGVCGGDPFECSVPFSVSSLPEKGMDKTIHQLATKCIIRELQEEDLAAESQEMLKRLVTKEVRKVPQSKKELIIELSIAANVLCQESSFVAVDEESSEPVQGSIELQRIPVAGAYDSLQFHSIADPCFRARSPLSPTLNCSNQWVDMHGSYLATECYDDGNEECYEDVAESSGYMFEEFSPIVVEGSALRKPLELPAKGGSAPTLQDTFSAVVSQQRATGAWGMNGTVASLLSQSVAQVEMMSPIGQQLSELQSSIWATCIVIAWLEMECADLKDEWELLMYKAISWVKKQLVPGTLTSSDVLAAARKLF